MNILGNVVEHYVLLASIIFTIGGIGFLVRRNVLVQLMCVELMLNAVNLLLVAFSKMHHLAANDRSNSAYAMYEGIVRSGAGTDGQLFVFFIMVVAAAEVSVGLAIIVMMYRNIHSVDINFLNRLKH